jgi:TRAP-type C4-dicarboxylate transport system permease small subunit
MKTLGRILIILVAFAIVMGITYVAMNASNSSTLANLPAFERGGESFRPVDRERPEMDGADMRGGGWMFGLLKNIGIVAVIVALIIVPKSFLRRRSVPVRVR